MKAVFCYGISVLVILLMTTRLSFSMSAEELKELLDENSKITVIDVRSVGLFRGSHIPGAIHVPASLCEVKSFPPIGNVVVYGDELDENQPIKAVEALNKKEGITAEKLEGGLSRWQALNYVTTGKKGRIREAFKQISYGELESISKNNSDAVLVDLRTRPMQGFGVASKGESLTDLSEVFPGVQVENRSADGEDKVPMPMISGTHGKLYVLIDRGDGRSEEMALRLRAAGVSRVVILSGGEKALMMKGETKLERR